MKTLIKTMSLSVALAFALPAAAQYDNQEYVWARVVSVDPIVARSTSPESREVCWEQPVTYYQPGRTYPTYRRDPTTGALIGALVGGALGNQVGSGSGRTAATIAGAVIGGKVGKDVAADTEVATTEPRTRTGYEQVCETQTTQHTESRIVGYDVAYELEGSVFNTRTDAHPGDQIRVAVVPYED